MFKCPYCKNRHSVPNNYDNSDFICPNTSSGGKTWQDMEPTDLLEKNMFNWNRSSTKVDEKRATTIKVNGPYYRDNGERITSPRKRNY